MARKREHCSSFAFIFQINFRVTWNGRRLYCGLGAFIAGKMHRMCTFRATSCMRWTPLMVPCCIRRWNSFAAGATGAGPADSEAAGSPDMSAVMERAAEARKEIHELWLSMEEMGDRQGRLQQVKELVEKYKLVPSTPREEDVSRGLGDAYDRLLLLCLPLGKAGAHGTDVLESLMHLAGRNGRELSVRTIQHLFSWADSFAEALAVFFSMRRCHVAMNMEAYYAMLYSLQRLEEEGWAHHSHDEAKESGAPS
uniref:WGS project CAEQ00000000 data, annotated contig 881 n=1 Tax=Trypanosoma congolense (strain IL3000) TaxID=1068625 RepID=F9WJ78_TRYCI|nr:unnamed protein product [Trypanosoma congolense IL3000]